MYARRNNIAIFFTHLQDRLKNKPAESSNSSVGSILLPLLRLLVVEAVTPQFPHQLLLIDFELSMVQFSELFQGKSPPVKTGTKPNSAFVRTNLDIGKDVKFTLFTVIIGLSETVS